MNNDNQSSEVKTKNITLGLVFSYIVGSFLILFGVIGLFSSTVPSFFMLLAGLIMVPPTNDWTAKKLKFKLSGGVKFLVIIILIGIAIASMKSRAAVTEENPVVAPVSTSEVKKTDVSTAPTKPAVQKVVPAPLTKSYQQVFTFSGNGIKKSSPFTISGDRFKIKYNCQGDFCSAYLYRVGSSLPDVFMNATGSLNDETIEYSGPGEYYIQANIIGTYTMTVEDYK